MLTNTIVNPITNYTQYYATDNLQYFLDDNIKRLFVCNDGILIKKWGKDIKEEDGYENIIGVIHCSTGPAIIYKGKTSLYFLKGLPFKDKEEWFAALISEEREEAIWAL